MRSARNGITRLPLDDSDFMETSGNHNQFVSRAGKAIGRLFH